MPSGRGGVYIEKFIGFLQPFSGINHGPAETSFNVCFGQVLITRFFENPPGHGHFIQPIT